MSQTRWPALAVLCAGAFMAIVDETIVAVSLPVIQRDLGFSESGLAWVTGAYLVAFAGLLLLSGRLGDLLGRKRIFVTGLWVFTVASALCGLSFRPEMLITARFAQGLGAAALSAVVLGMIVTLFPAPGERAVAIGVYSFVQASGGTVGMLAGGLVTQIVSWHWVFFVNIPIGVAALVLAARLLTGDRGTGIGRGADAAGAILITTALMVGVYTIVTVEHHGWASVHTLGFGALSLALLAGFVARQATAVQPLLPLRLFRSRTLSGANVVLFLLVASMFGFMFLTVLFLRQVCGYGAEQTGFAMVPVALTIAAMSVALSARLNHRFGEQRVLLAGLALIVGGFVLLAHMPVEAIYAVHVLPAMLLLGIGFGLAMPALMSLGMAGATPRDSGLTSGLFNTTQQVGGAIGLSVLAVLAATRTSGLAAQGVPANAALAGGYHLAYWIGACLIGISFCVTAAILRPADAPTELTQRGRQRQWQG